MPTPEGHLKIECVAILKQTNLMWWVNFLGPVLKNGGRAKNPNKGMLDLTVIQKATGRHIFVEFKAKKKGKLSAEQIDWMERCGNNNVPVFVVDDVRDFYPVVKFALANIDTMSDLARLPGENEFWQEVELWLK